MRRPRSRARRIDVGDLAFRLSMDSDPRSSAAPMIVLVHGIGMSSRYFTRLRDALLPHSRVVSIDMPGFGWMPRPRRAVDVETMATALGEVVASLDAGPVVLVGHSMGTQWVVELGRLRPDLVSRVVVIGPVSDVDHRSATAQGRALAVDTLLESPATNWIVTTDYIRCGVPWYIAQLGPMLTYPIEERVRQLAMPLLIIRGERDPIASTRWCRLLRDSAPVGSLVHIPRAPHNAQRWAPRAVAAAILAHL